MKYFRTDYFVAGLTNGSILLLKSTDAENNIT